MRATLIVLSVLWLAGCVLDTTPSPLPAAPDLATRQASIESPPLTVAAAVVPALDDIDAGESFGR